MVESVTGMDYFDFFTGFVAGVVIWIMLSYFARLNRDRGGLKSRMCVCGHRNHVHKDGSGECMVSYGKSEEFPEGSSCACDIFIEKPEDSPDNSARELEKLVGF